MKASQNKESNKASSGMGKINFVKDEKIFETSNVDISSSQGLIANLKLKEDFDQYKVETEDKIKDLEFKLANQQETIQFIFSQLKKMGIDLLMQEQQVDSFSQTTSKDKKSKDNEDSSNQYYYSQEDKIHHKQESNYDEVRNQQFSVPDIVCRVPFDQTQQNTEINMAVPKDIEIDQRTITYSKDSAIQNYYIVENQSSNQTHSSKAESKLRATLRHQHSEPLDQYKKGNITNNCSLTNEGMITLEQSSILQEGKIFGQGTNPSNQICYGTQNKIQLLSDQIKKHDQDPNQVVRSASSSKGIDSSDIKVTIIEQDKSRNNKFCHTQSVTQVPTAFGSFAKGEGRTRNTLAQYNKSTFISCNTDHNSQQVTTVSPFKSEAQEGKVTSETQNSLFQTSNKKRDAKSQENLRMKRKNRIAQLQHEESCEINQTQLLEKQISVCYCFSSMKEKPQIKMETQTPFQMSPPKQGQTPKLGKLEEDTIYAFDQDLSPEQQKQIISTLTSEFTNKFSTHAVLYALNINWWKTWSNYTGFVKSNLYEELNTLYSNQPRSSVTVNYNIAQKIVGNNLNENTKIQKPDQINNIHWYGADCQIEIAQDQLFASQLKPQSSQNQPSEKTVFFVDGEEEAPSWTQSSEQNNNNTEPKRHKSAARGSTMGKPQTTYTRTTLKNQQQVKKINSQLNQQTKSARQ